MSATSDLLFAYLRNMFYATSGSELELDKLEEDYVMLGKGLMFYAHCVRQYLEFANSMARGDLGTEVPPPENELAAPLKSIHANLKHLTWQSQQVAKGDYKQRVDYMGEFADAFNTMVEQLADRQHKLENEIDISRKRTEAMEQSNLLFRELMRLIPQQIFVVSIANQEILLTNDMAQSEIDYDSEYISEVINLLPGDEAQSNNRTFDLQLIQDGKERFLVVNMYPIEWQGENAAVLIINDVSTEKMRLKELENYAYRDALTHTYNRFYGMLALNEWMESKRPFSLVFVDLDNLKYVNDKFGHKEGDIYIIKMAGYLQSYSQDTVVCRLGGDEYMLLVPDASFDEANSRMEEIQQAIQSDEYLKGKDYYYSISFGVVAIDENTEMSSSDALSVADERMYVHKRMRKKGRQVAV